MFYMVFKILNLRVPYKTINRENEIYLTKLFYTNRLPFPNKN